MSIIVGYLYKGARYTPLAIKEVLIRENKIPRSAFEPRRDLGGLGYRLPEPELATVIDAYAKVSDGRMLFMDQPDTYSDMDWPKFIFDDEVTEQEQAYFTGISGVREAEKAEAVRVGFAGIARAQGWNDASMLAVVLSYVDHLDLAHDLAAFAAQVADEENQGSDL